MSASEHRIYFLLQVVAHRLQKRADSALKASAGLTTAQAAALSVIAKYGPVSQRFVADKLSQRESAVMTMADRLKRAGYIKRTKSEKDGRAWDLIVTKEGSMALENMGPVFEEINALFEKHLDPEEIYLFAANLKSILATLSTSD